MGCSRSKPDEPSLRTSYTYKPLQPPSRQKKSHHYAQDEFLLLYRRLIVTNSPLDFLTFY